MALRSPRKLPRTLNRPVSRYTRALVKKRRTRQNSRKRQQMASFWRRRSMKIGKVVLSELRLWAIIGVTSIVVIGAGILVFSPLFDVKQIRVQRDDSRLDAEEIQHTLSPLFRHRLFLITRAQIEELLLPKFPDIIGVNINKDYPSTLNVGMRLDPLIAKLTIVDDAPVQMGSGVVLAPATGTGGYSYLTAKGYVLLSQVKLEKDALPGVKVRDWAVRPDQRSFLLDPAFIKTFFDTKTQLEGFFGTPVTAMTVYVRANEFHLQDQGKSFWFDATSSIDEQFARLREFLKVTNLNQVKFYVDLRLTDKVVFE